MKQIFKFIGLPILLGFIFLSVYLFVYLGGWQPVVISGPIEREALHQLYKVHRGAYHQIGPVIAEVEKWAQSNQVPCQRTFGEYLDDPGAVDEDRLTSHGGCVLETPFAGDLPSGLLQKALPPQPYVQADFAGSPAIGPWRVYPKILDYLAKNRLQINGPTLEIYTIHSPNEMTTQYLVPVVSNPPSSP